MTEHHGDAPTLVVEDVSKSFGSTRAVRSASFHVARGELIGIAGHNGAGKSTVLKVVNGSVPGDVGSVTISGVRRSATEAVAHPEHLGVRTVYQELALAPSLRVDETAAVFDPSARGRRWRSDAWKSLKAVLDEMFPAHGIRPGHVISDLSFARRQMIECAMTMVDAGRPASLVILDEPTSSLDGTATESFYAYLKRRAAGGLSAIVTTHRLNEMIENLDRIYVMRDGRVLGEHVAATSSKESLVAAMGLAEHEEAHRAPEAGEGPSLTRAVAVANAEASDSGSVVELVQQGEDGAEERFEIRPGEIIGFAGLEGHGQLEALEAVHRAAARRPGKRGRDRRTEHLGVSVVGDAAYVSGDRGVRGIFPIWDVAKNLSFSSLKRPVTRGGLISKARERELIDEWYRRLGIKGAPSDLITSLSGGTQQKALMARAMAVHSSLLLLEDPTRGVDQATKGDFYGILREQADKGQTIVWYSTENEELRNCDRVLVFQVGRVVGTLTGEEATEDAVIALSFGQRTRTAQTQDSSKEEI
ncbi:sugar ABC transporter ATP-binding protein [Leucobacter weissii]|uniref:Sugar ABC transporter ATP-binding protein n=1 Tax=Leucobacter weissii TaxID=1983706 RepID=A0A939MSS6_9MICO|nr:sugar ABC transporter ATP-binding protein [Leucobacter weissii]MBO1902329.1 sugar ABC transporter ATP-binding protein [Leucobacter weissii]